MEIKRENTKVILAEEEFNALAITKKVLDTLENLAEDDDGEIDGYDSFAIDDAYDIVNAILEQAAYNEAKATYSKTKIIEIERKR